MYPVNLSPINSQRLWTEQFMGLDRRPRTYDGTFSAMGNMTGEPWPLLSSRGKRGLVAELENPQGMCVLGKLAWIDGSTLYFDGKATEVNSLSLEENMLPKRMVTMGAYILIFPDKVYYNTVDPSDSGTLDRLWASEGSVAFTLCTMDGVDYPRGRFTVSDEPPQAPSDGDYWINTSGSTHALYKYSELYEDWIGENSVYIKISASGIGAGLKTQDGVKISGIAYDGSNAALKKQLEMLNEAMVVQAASDDYIVVVGLIDQNWTQTEGTIRADRQAPDMDFVIECNNRLWGCRYGVQADGEFYNILYASAMGDFKNWQKFMGTAQDSYYVYVGSEGPFTGAAVHRGSPYFFKRNCVHKIYGEKPSNFQTQLTLCEGVAKGAENTLTGYNGALYYLGDSGVKYFESLPQDISPALGPGKMRNGAAGECAGKYYLSAQEESGAWSLYVWDTERHTWYREDGSRALAFAAMGGNMYMLLTNGLLYCLSGAEGEKEAEDVVWFAETGEMGYEYPDHKYLSRILARVQMSEGAECTVSIQYNGDGIWHKKGVLQGAGTVKSYLLPIVPSRCESAKLRFAGHGEFRLYGIARELSMGVE